MYVPSLRRRSFRIRTTTAFTTVPLFGPGFPGVASLTAGGNDVAEAGLQSRVAATRHDAGQHCARRNCRPPSARFASEIIGLLPLSLYEADASPACQALLSTASASNLESGARRRMRTFVVSPVFAGDFRRAR